MNISEYLNNRELAAVIWIAVLTLFALKVKDVRKCLRNLIAQAFIKKFNIVYVLMLSYIALILFGLSEIDLWDLTQSKTTIFWIALSAIPTIFKTNSLKDGNITFKSLVFDHFRLVAIVGVMVNSYVFGIIVEIIIFPILVILEKLIFVCDNNKTQENRLAHKFLNSIMGVIAFLLILHGLYGLYDNPEVLLTKQAVFDFLLPIVLTIAFIPFLYCLMVYSIYESVFITINIFIKDPILYKRVKCRARLLFNFRTKLLERWQKHFFYKDVTSYDEVKNSIKEILRIDKNERKNLEIAIENGWSLNAAKNFLINHGFLVSDYNPPQNLEYYKTWSADSNTLRIDDDWSLKYYIDGDEGVVRSLTLSMSINDKQKALDAHKEFFRIALFLYKEATNSELSIDTEKALLNKNGKYEERFDNFKTVVEYDHWENGYRVSFSILNNKYQK